MDFSFNTDQTSLGETVGRMLADHPSLLLPEPAPADQDAAWHSLAELGLFTLLVPEPFDGAGLSLVDVAVAVEALGAGLAPPCVAATLAATDLLVHHGSHVQKQDLLPRIARGEVKFAISLLEADQGYDPEDIVCSTAKGLLNGTKILVEEAETADMLVVLARDAEGPRLFLVDPATPGVVLRRHTDLDPASGFCGVSFDGVRIDSEAIAGKAAVARLLETGATLSSGLLTGIATRMLETSVEYAKTRHQFGQPIGAFQAIKHRCADMAVALEAARSTAYYAFWAISEDAPDSARAASMAKSCCGESARMICNEAIQIHGGMGFTWELGLHRFLRRARVLEYAFGDAAWHNEQVLTETLASLAADRNALAVVVQ